MKQQVLELDQITYTYPSEEKIKVLDDLSFAIAEGEWIAIVGQNGSGKSTTAKIINGLIVPDSGKVTISGEVMTEENVWQLRSQIGMVFQNPDNQFVGATVEDDIAFGMENLGFPREKMVKLVDLALQSVQMSDFREKEPARLSGGQKQRVAIAGVIALSPKILILDEATAMLDPRGRIDVLKTIRRLKEEKNLTVISITHDLEEASLADRILVLQQGKLVASGTPSAIFSQVDQLPNWGLALPFTEQLKQELKKQKITFPNEYLTEERMAKILWESLSKV